MQLYIVTMIEFVQFEFIIILILIFQNKMNYQESIILIYFILFLSLTSSYLPFNSGKKNHES